MKIKVDLECVEIISAKSFRELTDELSILHSGFHIPIELFRHLLLPRPVLLTAVLDNDVALSRVTRSPYITMSSFGRLYKTEGLEPKAFHLIIPRPYTHLFYDRRELVWGSTQPSDVPDYYRNMDQAKVRATCLGGMRAVHTGYHALKGLGTTKLNFKAFPHLTFIAGLRPPE